jgi:hypothetical protein
MYVEKTAFFPFSSTSSNKTLAKILRSSALFHMRFLSNKSLFNKIKQEITKAKFFNVVFCAKDVPLFLFIIAEKTVFLKL